MINRKHNQFCNRIIQDAANAYMQDEIAFLQSGDITDIENHPRVQELVMRHIQSITNTSSRLLMYAKRIAMVALITYTIGFITCMCIPSVRSAFLNFIETLYENDIGIHFTQNTARDDLPQMIDITYSPKIPSDWSINTVLHNHYEVLHEIKGVSGEFITFNQIIYSPNPQTTYIDNDPISTETVYLNDSPATLYTYADGALILLWTDRYVFTMTAHHTSRETLLALAESVSE